MKVLVSISVSLNFILLVLAFVFFQLNQKRKKELAIYKQAENAKEICIEKITTTPADVLVNNSADAEHYKSRIANQKTKLRERVRDRLNKKLHGR